MSGINDYVGAVAKAFPSLEAMEYVPERKAGRLVSAYVRRYSMFRAHRAFLAIEDGDVELANRELRRHLKENYGISPWARLLLRYYIGQI